MSSSDKLGTLIQTSNWETEKHVPFIECPSSIERGVPFDVTVTLGKNQAHPNTTEHHIRWMSLHFKPQDENKTYEVAHYQIGGHGESPKGPNEEPVHTGHTFVCEVTLKSAGMLYALASCNIHGLWEHSKELSIGA
jgi:superoxide reductase